MLQIYVAAQGLKIKWGPSRAQNKAIPPVLYFQKMQEWQKNSQAIPMNWQILGHPRTKAIPRNDSFYSGMAVSLTCQSCGLACPQRLILPLPSERLNKKFENQ